MAKSRTRKSPALWRKGSLKKGGYIATSVERVCVMLIPVSAFVAAIFLVQSVYAQSAYNLGTQSVAPAFSQLIPLVREELVVAEPFSIGTPVRLKIPRLRVNASILGVGVALDGSMAVPKLPRDAAWYKFGPKPGETGSAVIAGHVNWLYNATGVFERLKFLKPGDAVTVQDDAGREITFKVRELRTLGLRDDATRVFVSSDGQSHLNLITCSGVWDNRIKRYTKRLVVFTDKIVTP